LEEKRVSKLESVLLRIRAIEYLKLLKKKFTYDQLAKALDLSAPVLNRYVKGHVLPRDDRALRIIEFAEKHIDLREEVLKRIKFDDDGFFDNTKIIFDITLLKLIVSKSINKFIKMRVNKVLTAAADGIPLATLVASELGTDLVYAKREKEVGVKIFVEETCILGRSGVTVSLYLPKGAIKPKERVLIVDDIIRTGETQRALINLVKKSRATVAGIFVLIAIGKAWRKMIPENIPVDVFLEI